MRARRGRVREQEAREEGASARGTGRVRASLACKNWTPCSPPQKVVAVAEATQGRGRGTGKGKGRRAQVVAVVVVPVQVVAGQRTKVYSKWRRRMASLCWLSVPRSYANNKNTAQARSWLSRARQALGCMPDEDTRFAVWFLLPLSVARDRSSPSVAAATRHRSPPPLLHSNKPPFATHPRYTSGCDGTPCESPAAARAAWVQAPTVLRPVARKWA